MISSSLLLLSSSVCGGVELAVSVSEDSRMDDGVGKNSRRKSIHMNNPAFLNRYQVMNYNTSASPTLRGKEGTYIS